MLSDMEMGVGSRSTFNLELSSGARSESSFATRTWCRVGVRVRARVGVRVGVRVRVGVKVGVRARVRVGFRVRIRVRVRVRVGRPSSPCRRALRRSQP